MPEDLATLKRRILALAERIGASEEDLPTLGHSLQDGRPHIEIRDTYDFVSCERGREFGRKSTTDPDELLYWAFECATFAMATSYELNHRRPDEDSRRQWFALQEDLLGRLSPEWKACNAQGHGLILERAPFDDGLSSAGLDGRTTSTAALRATSAAVAAWLKVPSLLLGVVLIWLSSMALVFLALAGIYLMMMMRWRDFYSDPRVATDFYLEMMVIGPFMIIFAYAVACPLTLFLCHLFARRLLPASSLDGDPPAPPQSEGM